ncbi:MAG: hypothetical protein ACOZQL_15905 [Myxococcota bacterium]
MLSSLLVPALVMAQQASAPTPTAPESSQPAPATSAAPTTATAPTAGNALANAVQARTPEEQAKQSGFQFIVAFDNWLGTGTFVDPKTYAYLASNLTLVAAYQMPFLGKRLRLSGSLRGTYEYTLPDSETGRRWTFYDAALSASIPAVFKDSLTGISLTPSLGLTLPASPESIQAGLITNLRVGVTALRRAGPFDLSLTASGTRSFYARPFSAVANPAAADPTREPRDKAGNLLILARNGEPFAGWSNWNPAWGVSVGGQVQWRATGELMLIVGYTYLHTWREMATDTVDEYTSKALDSNGNPVAHVGYGRGDRTSTFVDLSYQLNEHYSLDLGFYTFQSPLTGTGQVRFPFLSFGTWAENNMNFFLTLTAAY